VTRKRYVVPSVEIHDAAVSEPIPPIIFFIILSLGAVALVASYGAICNVLNGRFSWGVNYIWFVPVNIWVQCVAK